MAVSSRVEAKPPSPLAQSPATATPAALPGGSACRVEYVFITFPTLSETFYQREVRALRDHGADLHLHSLWGGGDDFDGMPVRRFAKWRLLLLPWWLGYWSVRRPRAVAGTLVDMARRWPPSWLSLGENLLGLAYAVLEARRLEGATRAAPVVVQAAWASAPASTALALGRLLGLPFTTGAHAYDLFHHGGDWLLEPKLREASAVITSTAMARDAACRRGADPQAVTVVRRGLEAMPPPRPPRAPRSTLRLLAVGRLVEKKGYAEQIAIYRALAAAGVPFQARIVGGGPLADALRRQIRSAGLGGEVELLGPMDHAAVVAQYEWADVLLFTGRVAADGDRDGLPNVVPEAMAHGVPVVVAPAAGVLEAVDHGRTGLVVALDDVDGWVAALCRLQTDDALYHRLVAAGRAWVARHFDGASNARALLDVLVQAASAAGDSER